MESDLPKVIPMGHIKGQELQSPDPYTIALSIPQVHGWQFCSVNLGEQHSLPNKKLPSSFSQSSPASKGQVD